ncbi:hypothetical protein Vsou_25060 [Vulcanisaeta souniana JCM 11219]|uniref:Uncharacterized protein n=1 Tax=Vulcanisaeta souniana JCM 11219 TaxID=1293586 RepID=A0ABM8BQU4_9CREN|nr:hypothetical protein Vsou_25060 [Vulcanisaeta souniana JCM 11219]
MSLDVVNYYLNKHTVAVAIGDHRVSWKKLNSEANKTT